MRMIVKAEIEKAEDEKSENKEDSLLTEGEVSNGI
jgi:hypothetical protein